MGNIKRFIN